MKYRTAYKRAKSSNKKDVKVVRRISKGKRVAINQLNVNAAIAKVKQAVSWLKAKSGFKILIMQTCNLGDTLHITPIAKHYKTVYPNCTLAFIVGDSYYEVHANNEDFDQIFTIKASLTGQERILVGQYLVSNSVGIDKVLCPSIFPFGEIWDTHKWCHEVISHQYWHNAEIRPPSSIKGDKKLKAPVTEQDKQFADEFIGNRKCIALEYHSYSHPVPWKVDQFVRFVNLVKKKGYECISFAGKNEGMIPGTIDARGMSWRRTIAVIAKCDCMVGIGSGITMLACCSRPIPKIIELNVSPSISMNACGYADSIAVSNANPDKVAEMI